MLPKIVTVDCDCKKGQEFCSGNKPEFYKDLNEAIGRFHYYKNLNRIWALFDIAKVPIPPQYAQYQVEKALYWGVHINGKHIVSVKP